MTRKNEPERIVISTFPKLRPYGVRLSVLFESSTKLKIDGECSLLISPDYVLKIAPSKSNIPLGDSQCWDVAVEAFATAGEAEQIGLRVSMGFLWAAVSGKYSLRLLYQTPLPCSVYDRTKSGGLTLSGTATPTVNRNINNVIDRLNYIVSSSTPVDQRLLVAMELFASARMETTERSRFVGMVSSLEPLACQRKYENQELESLISNYKTQLSSSTINTELKEIMRSKIDGLRIESISKAIRRLIMENLPGDPGAIATIEEAYRIRSRILHDGATDADLEMKGKEAEAVVRKVFEKSVANFVSI